MSPGKFVGVGTHCGCCLLTSLVDLVPCHFWYNSNVSLYDYVFCKISFL